jgi:hypothetical protein
MSEHQTRLAANISKFTSVFLNSSVLDYNIGVTTTTADKPYYGGSSNCCGQFVGSTRVVNKNIVGADQVLATNLIVGTNGDSTEKPFEATYLALTEPNLSVWNKGFYRKDASLVVIYITDAEDQSDDHGESAVYDLMLGLKGGDKNRILAYGAIVPTNDTLGCPRDQGDPPTSIETFLGRFINRKNNEMNLCDPDFGVQLGKLAKDIVENSGRVILLNRAPDRDSIAVTYGSMDLPEDAEKGWIFDPARNAIILGHSIDWAAQPAGSKIKVFYNAYKYDDK